MMTPAPGGGSGPPPPPPPKAVDGIDSTAKAAAKALPSGDGGAQSSHQKPASCVSAGPEAPQGVTRPDSPSGVSAISSEDQGDAIDVEELNTEILCCDETSLGSGLGTASSSSSSGKSDADVKKKPQLFEVCRNNVEDLKLWCEGNIGVEKILIYFVTKNQDVLADLYSGAPAAGASAASRHDVECPSSQLWAWNKGSGAAGVGANPEDTKTANASGDTKPPLFHRAWIGIARRCCRVAIAGPSGTFDAAAIGTDDDEFDLLALGPVYLRFRNAMLRTEQLITAFVPRFSMRFAAASHALGTFFGNFSGSASETAASSSGATSGTSVLLELGSRTEEGGGDGANSASSFDCSKWFTSGSVMEGVRGT